MKKVYFLVLAVLILGLTGCNNTYMKEKDTNEIQAKTEKQQIEKTTLVIFNNTEYTIRIAVYYCDLLPDKNLPSSYSIDNSSYDIFLESSETKKIDITYNNIRLAAASKNNKIASAYSKIFNLKSNETFNISVDVSDFYQSELSVVSREEEKLDKKLSFDVI